ncbi:unnamed protein product, partial [Iphiclides podalirius]
MPRGAPKCLSRQRDVAEMLFIRAIIGAPGPRRIRINVSSGRHSHKSRHEADHACHQSIVEHCVEARVGVRGRGHVLVRPELIRRSLAHQRPPKEINTRCVPADKSSGTALIRFYDMPNCSR